MSSASLKATGVATCPRIFRDVLNRGAYEFRCWKIFYILHEEGYLPTKSAHFIHYNNRTEDILREGASKTAIGSIYIIIKSEFTDLCERTLFEWILVLVVILIQVRWGCSVRQIYLY